MKTKSTGIGSVSDVQTAAAPAVAFGFRFDESILSRFPDFARQTGEHLRFE
jgi:hypothetical protein